MLEEDSALDIDHPRDKNNPDLDKDHYKLLHLDSYIPYENEKNLAQPRYDYVYQDKDDYYFKDEDINTDQDYDSLEVDSQYAFSFEIEPRICVVDFLNIIPKNKINYIKTVNNAYELNENLKWKKVKTIPKRLIFHNKDEGQRQQRRQNKKNIL
jgi:hypothetical protein